MKISLKVIIVIDIIYLVQLYIFYSTYLTETFGGCCTKFLPFGTFILLIQAIVFIILCNVNLNICEKISK